VLDPLSRGHFDTTSLPVVFIASEAFRFAVRRQIEDAVSKGLNDRAAIDDLVSRTPLDAGSFTELKS